MLNVCECWLVVDLGDHLRSTNVFLIGIIDWVSCKFALYKQQLLGQTCSLINMGMTYFGYVWIKATLEKIYK